jgi:hypothetical protein
MIGMVIGGGLASDERMNGKIAALLIAALIVAGCAQASVQNAQTATYAPYDYETNPFCGVYGSCQSLNQSYGIRSNW